MGARILVIRRWGCRGGLMLLGGIFEKGSGVVIAGVESVEIRSRARRSADSAGGTVWIPSRSGCARPVDDVEAAVRPIHTLDRRRPEGGRGSPLLVHSVVHILHPHRRRTAESCRSCLWTTVDDGGEANHIDVIPPDVDRPCPQGCGEGWGHRPPQDSAVHRWAVHPQGRELSTGLSTAVDNVEGVSTAGRGSEGVLSPRAACA